MNSQEHAGEPTPPSDRTGPVVVPSIGLRAIVRFAPPPTEPPDDLVAWVVRSDDDWMLTDDSVAFGDHRILDRYRAWRATWEMERVLDPLPDLVRLVRLVTAETVGGPLVAPILEHLVERVQAEGEVALRPDQVLRLRMELQDIGDVVRERDALGHGIVDQTPGAQRVGLARSWPACGGLEVLSAAHGLEVVLLPGEGLLLRVDGGALTGPIERVSSDSDGWTVDLGGQELRLDHRQARALAWLVPGSTAWRHVRVPEVVTWASTLGGLDECLELATEHGLGVRIVW